MKRFKNRLILILLVLLILIVVFPLIVFLVLARQKEQPGGLTPGIMITRLQVGVTAWPVISRDVPSFALSSRATSNSFQMTIFIQQ